MKRLLPLLLAMVLLCCGMTTALAADRFGFDKSVNSVFEDESVQLELIREGDCEEGEVTFKSSNPKIVTVDDWGVITGVKKGSATITATLRTERRTFTAKLSVTVMKPVTEIEVNEEKLPVYEAGDPAIADALDEDSDLADLPVLVIRKGKAVTISATCQPSSASNRKVELQTSDEDVVSIRGTAVTGRRAGECMLTVQSVQNPEVSRSYRVLVVEPVTRVRVTADKSSMFVGESIMLEAEVSPDSATIRQVQWSSSSEKVAVVDDFGVVTGVSRGSATITATAADGSGKKATIKVTVQQQPEGITLNQEAVTLQTGRYTTLKATVQPSSVSDKSVRWYSSDERVAKVNSGGRVTAVAPGVAIITCECANFPEVCTQAVITVYQPVTKVAFTQKSATVPVGETIALGWEVSPDTATDSSVTLSTNKDHILRVTQDGVVTGLKRGEAYVYATANDGSGKKATIKVTVTQPVEGVSMEKAEVSVGVGSRVSNNAVFTPEDASITNMTWTSHNEQIATVTGSGRKATVTGRSWGETTIIGVTEDGSYVTSFKVTVGNYDEALRITNLYCENDVIRIQVTNESNMSITAFYYEIELYDAWGNRLDCNYKNHSNSFEGAYYYTLAPGASTAHGRFSFGSEFSRPYGIGRVVMRITGYETSDGYSRFIRSENREDAEWQVTVLDYNY